jgi:phosphatidylglycerophosphatase C
VTAAFPEPRPDAPLVVFDFDHTLYDGDSGERLIAWLLLQSPLRIVAAFIATFVLAPLLAFVPTRRHGIGGYLWIATFGLSDYRDLNAMIHRYALAREKQLRVAMLPIALAALDAHRQAGDRVVIATGAPPELVHAILAFIGREEIDVVGSHEAPFLGGLITVDHCHSQNKLTCLARKGYGEIAVAYSDSSADLPLLKAARQPVVVNPKRGNVAMFRRELPPGTPMIFWGNRGRVGDPVPVTPRRAS